MNKLLIKLINYIVTEYDFYGMCGTILELNLENLITEEEYRMLKDYVESRRNHRRYKHHKGFWWKPKNKNTRLKWLDKEIATFENTEAL